MSFNLTSEDFAILLALESNPFMPMTELASLLGTTRITAKKRVDNLIERDIIRKPIAIYNPKSFDLKRVSVYAHTRSIKQMLSLEKACDEHPYTHYRVRAYGSDFGVFMQFDIPEKAIPLLRVFLDELKQKDILVSYELFPSSNIRTDTYADLSRYNAKLSSWNFSWEKWFQEISKQSKKLPLMPEYEIDYTKFTMNHFKILRMLTADGSIKQTEIKEKFNLSRTQAHRDYNFVIDNYVETIRFIYNREIFNLSETYIAFGFEISEENIAKIYNAFETQSPPFRLALDILQNNSIILWGNMSPSQASSFAFSMWKTFETTKILTLDTINSKLYWFYPENFDFNNQQWKVSENYIVTEPLQRTLK